MLSHFAEVEGLWASEGILADEALLEPEVLILFVQPLVVDLELDLLPTKIGSQPLLYFSSTAFEASGIIISGGLCFFNGCILTV